MNKKEVNKLIWGYIKNIQIMYDIHIPNVIFNIVFDYYDIITWETNDIWKSKYIDVLSDNIVISRSKKNNSPCFRSIFLSDIIFNGKYEYTFKVLKTRETLWDAIFGIYNIKYGNPSIESSFPLTKPECSYCFIFGGYLEERKSPGSRGRKYGRELKKNDELTMVIDMNKHELSYIINDINYGKAFDILDTNYKVGIVLDSKHVSVQLISARKVES